MSDFKNYLNLVYRNIPHMKRFGKNFSRKNEAKIFIYKGKIETRI